VEFIISKILGFSAVFDSCQLKSVSSFFVTKEHQREAFVGCFPAPSFGKTQCVTIEGLVLLFHNMWTFVGKL